MSAEDSHSKPKLKISSENYLREEGMDKSRAMCSQDHLVADDGWFPASNRSGIFEALCSDPSSTSSNPEKAHGITYFWEVAEIKYTT